MTEKTPCLKPDDLKRALPARGLFKGKGLPWLISPHALQLPKLLRRQIERLGPVLANFQDSSHLLYRQSAAGKHSPWLAEALDAGKPQWLIACQRSRALQQSAARIIRPDLILQDGKLALSELDSVPGGMGITHFLNQCYAQAGFTQIMGGPNGMTEGFRHSYPQGRSIAISEESGDYAAEMNYLAQELGSNYDCCQAEKLDGQHEARELYRFFELFDHAQIPAAQQLLQGAAAGELKLDPPPIAHLEEKAWLALFHQPALQQWWRQNLRGKYREQLLELIPHSWLLDNSPLPPNACLPWLNLNSWEEVGQLSQKERRLVLKISGFDERAWGARGVYIGHDMPSYEWQAALQQALKDQGKHCWVMQDFEEACLIQHPYYERESGQVKIMQGRARLCPYYFRSSTDKAIKLGGCLATIVPADKKKIHGMSDAILVPCY